MYLFGSIGCCCIGIGDFIWFEGILRGCVIWWCLVWLCGGIFNCVCVSIFGVCSWCCCIGCCSCGCGCWRCWLRICCCVNFDLSKNIGICIDVWDKVLIGFCIGCWICCSGNCWFVFCVLLEFKGCCLFIWGVGNWGFIFGCGIILVGCGCCFCGFRI